MEKRFRSSLRSIARTFAFTFHDDRINLHAVRSVLVSYFDLTTAKAE